MDAAGIKAGRNQDEPHLDPCGFFVFNPKSKFLEADSGCILFEKKEWGSVGD